MMANGSIVVKTNETNSRSGKSHRLLTDNDRHIIRNSGIQIIGGLVKVDMLLANVILEFIF